MIGNIILHYKILEKLGEGGMGVVYKAKDSKLDRFVAIKFLPSIVSRNPDTRERFKVEAKAAAALNHPNITTIYSVEEFENDMFIVMEFIDGMELTKKMKSVLMPADQAIDLAVQIAQGLNAAHKRGIIHRDIKPSNIMLTTDNLIKIMDFGLAKIKGATEITKLGTTLGTTYYMSPEQTKGETVDHRTDIWSFGVLLYQMLTGEFPFKGEYDQAIIYSILNEPFPSLKKINPSISPKLDIIVQKLLRKNPQERYINLDEVIKDLQTSSEMDLPVDKDTIPFKVVTSIAVLPIENISKDIEDEFFSDGLTEEIIRSLSQIRNLKVVAAASSFSLKGDVKNFGTIGKKLNVKSILDCSVKKSEYNIRVTAKLINAEDGFFIWSEQYDRILEESFSIKDEIVLKIIEKLQIHLLKDERLNVVKRNVKSVKAFSWYLKGRYFFNELTMEGLSRGIECFTKAIEIEGRYAPAYAGLADSYNMLGEYYYLPAKESFPKAIDAAEKAVESDDSLPEAFCALGKAKYNFSRDWKSAEELFLKGVGYNPGNSFGRANYAQLLLLLGRFDEAYQEISIAHELDPLGLITSSNVGYYYYLINQHDRALKEYNKLMESNPYFHPLLVSLAEVYILNGQFDMALETIKSADKIPGVNLLCLAELGRIYALLEEKIEALNIVEKLKEISRYDFVSATNYVIVYLGLNDIEKTFHWLEKSLEEQAPLMCYLKVDPRFDKIRNDNRFDKLLKKVGFK